MARMGSGSRALFVGLPPSTSTAAQGGHPLLEALLIAKVCGRDPQLPRGSQTALRCIHDLQPGRGVASTQGSLLDGLEPLHQDICRRGQVAAAEEIQYLRERT